MGKGNLIKDKATRDAVIELERFKEALENIQTVSVPSTADETTRVIIQTLNKIINSYKRRR